MTYVLNSSLVYATLLHITQHATIHLQKLYCIYCT